MIDPPSAEVLLGPSHESLAKEPPASPVSVPASHKPLLISMLLKRQANLSKFLARVHRVIHSREGLDITLLFVAEATRLLGALLDLLSKVTSIKSTRILVSLASILPKYALRSLSFTPTHRFTATASDASARLQALVIILEEWQILNRLWGLLDIWMSVKGAGEEGEDEPPPNKLDTAFTVMHRLSLASFHLCESTAWLSSKGVLRWSPEVQDKLFGWAAHSWGAFTCVELSRLLVDWYRKRQNEETADDIEWRKQWRKEFLHNLAWAPLAVHWSRLPEGCLPELLVAMLGFYPSLGYMKDIWQDTA